MVYKSSYLRKPHYCFVLSVWGLIFFGGMACQDQLHDQSKKPVHPKAPNFIILFADDMGYGDLGCYGHPTIRTPGIDKMAQEGIRLTSFYVASSVCTPSRAGLLTGRYPQRVGLPNVLMPNAENGLPADEVTIAEGLKEKGYKTMAIGKWHLGDKEKYNPIYHGFDDYYGILYSNDMMPPWVQTEKPLALMHGTEQTEYPVDQAKLTERYTEWGIGFIKDNKDQPFFLYLAYAMPHVPIFASAEFRGTSKGGLYGDVVETIDWSVGKILDQLDSLGLSENTMVVFASDNGPWQHMPDRMFREDIIKPWYAGFNGHLSGYKGNTYEGGIRVPGILRWPGTIPAGQVSADIVTSFDLLPTIFNAAGINLPDDRKIDGNNLMLLLTQQAASPTDTFYYYQGYRKEGVRIGAWKYRNSPFNLHAEKNTDELFNLDIDPAEEFNRADEFPDKVREMKAALNAFDKSITATQ